MSNKGILKITTEEFIERAIRVHGDKYDYSKVDYRGSELPVVITCPVHGEFKKRPTKHVGSKQGCPQCSLEEMSKRFRLSVARFIEKANETHRNKYDYSEVSFRNLHDIVTIICPEHGEFAQNAQSHMNGCGCPKCKESLSERDIRLMLEGNNIKYEIEKSWDWLVYKKHQFLDFWIPELNTGIECQGEQHFYSVKYFGGEYKHKETVKRDKRKLELCNKHGIRILYYSRLGEDFDYPYSVFTSTDRLLEELIRKT